MDPGSVIGMVLVCVVLFIIAFIKACWLYDEYRYKQAQEVELLPPPPVPKPVEVKPAQPVADDSPIGKMISEELEK